MEVDNIATFFEREEKKRDGSTLAQIVPIGGMILFSNPFPNATFGNPRKLIMKIIMNGLNILMYV
jgi:hypothetical protein